MRTELSEKRQRVLTIVVLLVLLSFVLRLFYFQVIAAPELNKESSAAMQINGTIPAIRGNIVDNAGNILAATEFSWDVNIDPVNVGPVVLDIDGNKVPFTKEAIAEKDCRNS